MLSMPRIVRPDPLRIAKQRFGSPVGLTTHRSIKRNKELANIVDLFALPSNGQKWFAPTGALDQLIRNSSSEDLAPATPFEASVKKVRTPRVQGLDPGEITFVDFPFRLKKSRK